MEESCPLLGGIQVVIGSIHIGAGTMVLWSFSFLCLGWFGLLDLGQSEVLGALRLG